MTGVTVLLDEDRVLSNSNDGTLRLWDLALGTQLATFYGDAPFTALAQGAEEVIVAFDSLGRLHVHSIE